jgi:hypothetical protein
MNRSVAPHTTLVLLLLDGTHVTLSWIQPVNFKEICRNMRDQYDQLKDGNVIVWAFLACGQQHNQYTENEVKEFIL